MIFPPPKNRGYNRVGITHPHPHLSYNLNTHLPRNPSFKVQSALLSRCRTFTLSKLTQASISSILHRALAAESPIPSPLLDDEMLTYLSRFADGDARTALNLLELALNLATRPTTTKATIKRSLTHTLVYDRSGDNHYDAISAFHKSVRGSNPDAALFWLSRMLKGGEDPLFIARRMVVMASEDIGLADNTMLPLATAAFTAVQQIGLPEARINLAHCAVALAESRKSVRAYRGLGRAMEAIEEDPAIAGVPIPMHLRNAPTGLMKELGYGREYKYNPDFKDGRVKQEVGFGVLLVLRCGLTGCVVSAGGAEGGDVFGGYGFGDEGGFGFGGGGFLRCGCLGLGTWVVWLLVFS